MFKFKMSSHEDNVGHPLLKSSNKNCLVKWAYPRHTHQSIITIKSYKWYILQTKPLAVVVKMYHTEHPTTLPIHE